MANENLVLSEAGVEKLTKTERPVPGLYDDPSGYCTFGIGHLVHKWNRFLLEAASTGDPWSKYLLEQRPGSNGLYLERSAASDPDFAKLKTRAVEIAESAVTQKWYKKRFDKLTGQEQAKVTAAATKAVADQASLLGKTPDEVLKEDLKQFEKAVRADIKVELTERQFDALVSLCFNIGPSAFSRSKVVAEITKNRYRSGSVQQRQDGIRAVENAFLEFNKSDGRVNAGLMRRRYAEADDFLGEARTELKELEKNVRIASGSPAVKI